MGATRGRAPVRLYGGAPGRRGSRKDKPHLLAPSQLVIWALDLMTDTLLHKSTKS
jgi:hypothetical protein